MTFSGSFGNATRNSVEVVVIIRKTVMSCLGRGLCSLSAFLVHLIHHNSTFLYLGGILVYVHEINVKYKFPWLIPHCLFLELLHQEYSSSLPEYKTVFVQESTNNKEKGCLQIHPYITVFELTCM